METKRVSWDDDDLQCKFSTRLKPEFCLDVCSSSLHNFLHLSIKPHHDGNTLQEVPNIKQMSATEKSVAFKKSRALGQNFLYLQNSYKPNVMGYTNSNVLWEFYLHAEPIVHNTYIASLDFQGLLKHCALWISFQIIVN